MFQRNRWWMWCLAGVSLAGAILAVGVTESRAQLAPRKADEWVTTLEGPQRVATQKIDQVLAKLSLEARDGGGGHRRGVGALFEAAGEGRGSGGKVYAVDIQQDLLDHINKRDKEENIRNVQTVLGEYDDPKLPARNVDLAFINDVLHHIQHRAAYLKALGTYMKPSGRIAIIEMDKNDPKTPHRNQPELLVAREDILKWMSDAGFKLVEEHPDLFPGTKWFLVFGRK